MKEPILHIDIGLPREVIKNSRDWMVTGVFYSSLLIFEGEFSGYAVHAVPLQRWRKRTHP